MVERDKLSMAVVGTGWAAEMFATAAASLTNGCLRFVVSRTLERANAFGERFDVPHRLSDPGDLPAPDRCPLVAVCVPPVSAPALTVDLLRRGFFVLLEKPGAENSPAFAALADQVEPEALSRLAVGYQLLHDKRFRLARRLSRAGCIGQLKRAYLRMYIPTAGWSDGRRKWALGPGAPSVWLEAGVHLIALARWLFGEPQVITSANVRSDGQCVAGTALLSHPGGVITTLDASYLAGVEEARGGLDLQGTRGSLSIERGSYRNKVSRLLVQHCNGRSSVRGPENEDGTANLLKRIISSIRKQGRLPAQDVIDYSSARELLMLAEALGSS